MLISGVTSSYSKNIPGISDRYAKPMNASDAVNLKNRLEEINAMDKENLSRPEKKQLRKEVKSIKRTQDSGGGVYISVGALILIIVLLIILL